jgi:hypothetical protein
MWSRKLKYFSSFWGRFFVVSVTWSSSNKNVRFIYLFIRNVGFIVSFWRRKTQQLTHMKNVKLTTLTQQSHNNPSHEGGPHTLGSTLMWGVVVWLLWWCCVWIKSLYIYIYTQVRIMHLALAQKLGILVTLISFLQYKGLD